MVWKELNNMKFLLSFPLSQNGIEAHP